MSWLLTALKQILAAIFMPHNDTIEISNRLFDDVTPVYTKRRRGARRKALNKIRRPPRREQ